MKSWLLIIVALVALTGCRSVSTADAEDTTNGRVSYVNPEGLHKNPVYSQVVVVSGRVRTVYVGGQNAVDAAGTVVGKGDIGAQATQVARNLTRALAGANARPEHVVKWNIYAVQGQSPAPAMAAFQRELGAMPNPPVITVVYVAALANPDYLLEVDAVAVVPDHSR